ncbi:MAG: HAMP domain-containing histidine kinase [Deltaproteobacteria bacterium]|nr:HAMP domain-containing histidine kinase [Deltaproteobacteria bacterium]
MFSKSLPKTLKSSSFRLALWYSSFFILSSILILTATYYFLSAALKSTDREAILSELNELSSTYNHFGMDVFQNEVTENIKYQKKNPFFVRIADWANRTLHVFNTKLWEEFDLNLLEKYSLKENRGWISLPAVAEDFDLMIASSHLKDGRWLQVGRSSEIRKKTLERFGEVFSIIMIPLILIGFAGGAYLSNRTLRPIRDIIQTVQSIETGDMEARVPRSGTEDELDELARLFNEMLDRIHTLISGMKGALDNVAHDLRTPMTRLRNMLETALRINGDVALYREALADCIEESDRVLNMLGTLMDISEAETGVLRLEQNRVNIPDMIYKIMDMYQYVAEEKGIEIKTYCPGRLYVTIDQNRISQAISNLLDNAIKYTPSGGRITIEVYENNAACFIKLNDTGIGISPRDLPRIWDRLYRADPSRSSKGLGLGLSVVKAIVKAHNGSVDVVSQPGKGSTFILSFPSDKHPEV